MKSTARATLRRTLRCRRLFVETFLCVVVFAAATTEQPNSLKDWPLDNLCIQNIMYFGYILRNYLGIHGDLHRP